MHYVYKVPYSCYAVISSAIHIYLYTYIYYDKVSIHNDTEQSKTVQYRIEQDNTVQHNIAQYRTAQRNTGQHNTI